MKTWNVPAVEELNVELTANGFCKKREEKYCWQIISGGHSDNTNGNTTEEEDGYSPS